MMLEISDDDNANVEQTVIFIFMIQLLSVLLSVSEYEYLYREGAVREYLTQL